MYFNVLFIISLKYDGFFYFEQIIINNLIMALYIEKYVE